jgi:hypothetical protein
VFRLRRLILKLTLALGVIPFFLLLVAISLPTIDQWLGRSGHPIVNRYVVRYYDDYKSLRIYRDGYPLGDIPLGRNVAAGWLFPYSVLCFAVASVEGAIRALERRNNRRRGFEVLPAVAPSSNDPLAPSPPRERVGVRACAVV